MNTKIEIIDNEQVFIPATISMQDFEIAELLGIMLPTVKGKIKSLLKSRFSTNCSGGKVMGNSIFPEYFGLEVVIAIAFQVDSYRADIFRKYILRKLTLFNPLPIYIGMNDVRDNNVS